ncbi:MAG TPA: anti-sigma factor [Actinobacteria bacterium]|nr:anti-sigma factor [Actinomycetota bacterium]
MTTGCDHAVEYVYQFLDGELTWWRRTRIRWHLRRCVRCENAFEFETKLKSVIRERGRTEPPAELFDTLRALIERERRSSPGQGR